MHWQYPNYFLLRPEFAVKMFRNALRQSGRAVGAVSGTGRVAVVSSKAPLASAVDDLVAYVKLV